MARIRTMPKDRPRLRPGRKGYRLGTQEFDGFPDQPHLEDHERVRIADMGRAAGLAITQEQRELLDRYSPAPASNAQRQTAADKRWVATSVPEGLLSLLTDDQARLVRQPSLHTDLEGARYPLTVGQLAQLAGATERQIRHWSDLRLLRSERHDGDRGFWPAAAAGALVLSDAPQHTKAVAAEVARGDGVRALALVGEALLVWAETLGVDQSARVERVAQALAELAEPAASSSPPDPDDDPSTGDRDAQAVEHSESSVARTVPGSSTAGARQGPSRAEQAKDLIHARPGITAAELAKSMGLSRNYLYRVLPRLEKANEIVKEHRGYHPAGVSNAAE
jgi:hypothetical protein